MITLWQLSQLPFIPDAASAAVQDDEYGGDSYDDVISRGAAVTVITGLFLKSLETSGLFRVPQFPLYQSLQRRGHKPSIFPILLVFLTLKTC